MLRYEVLPRQHAANSYYSRHCVVIHFAAHPPSKLWPTGIAACSHAECGRSKMAGRQ